MQVSGRANNGQWHLSTSNLEITRQLQEYQAPCEMLMTRSGGTGLCPTPRHPSEHVFYVL